jgi:hypothetical protein
VRKMDFGYVYLLIATSLNAIRNTTHCAACPFTAETSQRITPANKFLTTSHRRQLGLRVCACVRACALLACSKALP